MVINGIRLLSGNSNLELAQKIADKLSTSLVKSQVSRFSDGEISIKINESVRNSDVYVIQPTCYPTNESLMELLIMLDALKRASPERIIAVIPWFGYSRQDKKIHSRDPISARLVADLITVAGANRIITMDLHAAQIQGFFNIPVDNLTAMNIFVDYYKKMSLKDPVIVAPDLGDVKRARDFATKLQYPLAIIEKRRPMENVSEVMNVIGEVKNNDVIMIDDMIDTAGTIVNAANALKDKGAMDIYVCATHPILSGNSLEKLQNSSIKEVVVTDTIPFKNKIGKIKSLSISGLLAEAIRCTHEGKSISTLFD